MAGIFKAYDIRGIYGDTLTDDISRAIGRAFVDFLGCRTVVVGRDMRSHSPAVFAALARGLTEQGADVVDVGLCSTPMCYFANGSLGADASIMITASHNPGQWNGFKMCREQAIPISGATGIADIEARVAAGNFGAAQRRGSVTSADVAAAYHAHIREHASLGRPLRIAADFANAMGIVEHRALDGLFEIAPLFDELDGSFPNHEANPLDLETLESLQERVREGGFDFGIAYDGDADRVGFVDERGDVVPMDIITALIAKMLLKEQKGRVFYDLRSSKAVREVISEEGGEPMMSRVGHAFIKQQMREADALFAGELSGHYYFRENYFTESSALAVLYVANLVSNAAAPLSELVRPIQRYVGSGEINSTVDDAATVFDALKREYADGRMTELDGLSIEFDDWWFNVRSSNTEPLVRLNLEADDRATMERRRDEVLAIVRG
ncbi:MAG: phosphomannomutase/phosphoglucomutase [Gammaproteobacteria bacterium]